MVKESRICKIPIIAMDHTKWDGNWMNRQHLLSRLGERGWMVIYSNGAQYVRDFDFDNLISRIRKSDNVNLVESGYFLPRSHGYSYLDSLAISVHAKGLKRAANLGIRDPFIGLCFEPSFYPYFQEMGPTYLMFHIYDVYSKIPSRTSTSYLDQVLARANLITASSEFMWRETVKNEETEMNIVHNGVDYDFFQNFGVYRTETVEEIKGLNGTKIGYIGAINAKIDFKLLLSLSKEFSKEHFILVGDILESAISRIPDQFKAYAQLREKENFHFFPRVSRNEVPQLMSLMDINAIFYRQDTGDWVSSGYPLKLNEYLAIGNPVITSYMPIIEKYFSSQVAICKSIKEWREELRELLAGKQKCSSADRKFLAKENDWNHRVDVFEDHIIRMLRE